MDESGLPKEWTEFELVFEELLPRLYGGGNFEEADFERIVQATQAVGAVFRHSVSVPKAVAAGFLQSLLFLQQIAIVKGDRYLKENLAELELLVVEEVLGQSL